MIFCYNQLPYTWIHLNGNFAPIPQECMRVSFLQHCPLPSSVECPEDFPVFCYTFFPILIVYKVGTASGRLLSMLKEHSDAKQCSPPGQRLLHWFLFLVFWRLKCSLYFVSLSPLTERTFQGLTLWLSGGACQSHLEACSLSRPFDRLSGAALHEDS